MASHFTAESLVVPATFSEPYPVYEALRGNSPFKYPYVKSGSMPGIVEDVSSWALLRYEDVRDALRDDLTFSSEHPLTQMGAVPKLALLHDDAPRHAELRKLLHKTFSPAGLVTLESWIKNEVREILEKIVQPEIETIQSIALPLPIMAAAHVLGFPPADYKKYRKWSEHFLSVARMSKDERQSSIQEMSSFIRDQISARRKFPVEDLLTQIVYGRLNEDPLEEEDMVGLCALVLIAGNFTTTNLIGNVLNLLAEKPNLWMQLKGNRGLIENLIKESLRWESPAQRLLRTATRNVTLSGAKIMRGDAVTIFFGSANRDPEHFDRPNEFRLDRNTHPHLAFGTGVHACIGAALAQLEVRILLNALLDRYSSIKPGAEPPVRQSRTSMFFGFETLPLKFLE